jgi:hypothetical protein
MGHRALVAYERTDGQYTLHYSQWGAANLKLKHRISAESPFGGDDTDSKWAKQLLAELADGLEADAVDGYLADEDRPSTVVEPKPRATGLTLDEIVADHLDYLHHEAFFVVSTTFEVTAYRTLWFGLQYESETDQTGRDGREWRARDGALVRRRAGRRRPPAGAVRGLQRCRRRHARKRRLHTVDGETVSEAEARRAGRRPTGAAHSDRGITLREGESEPFIDQDCVDQLLFFRGGENRAPL